MVKKTKIHISFFLMVFILACGCGSAEKGSGGGENTGSIALNVNWQGAAANSPDANLNMAAALDCAASSVATVSAYVYDASNTLLSSGGPWSCSAHSGTISNVPAGSSYTVRVEGLHSSGAVTWRGEVAGVSVTSGQTTSAGITMSYIGSTTLLTGINFPCGIAVDSNNVYWTENATTGGSVKKVPINGGTATTLASGLNAVTGGVGCLAQNVMVDAASVYWGEASTVYDGNDAAVRKVPINGGTVTTLAFGRNQLAGIATDSSDVYFAEQGLSKVSKIAKSGGAVTMLGNMLNYPIGIAIDATNVYGAVNNNWYAGQGSVQKISINGGASTTLASGLNAPFYIAVDTTSVYWINHHIYNAGNTAQQTDGTGAIQKVSINGGTVTTLAAGLNRPNQIVVDSGSGYVYWTEKGTHTGDFYNNGTGTVKKVSINGGTVTILASGLNYPYGIIIESTNVYWSELGTYTNSTYNTSTGAIKKIAK